MPTVPVVFLWPTPTPVPLFLPTAAPSAQMTQAPHLTTPARPLTMANLQQHSQPSPLPMVPEMLPRTTSVPIFLPTPAPVSPNDASPPPYDACSHPATAYGQPTPAQSAQPPVDSASSVPVAYTHTCPAFPSNTSTVSPNDTRPPPYDACSHPATAYGQPTAAQSALSHADSASNVPVDHTCPAFSSSASIVSPIDTSPPPYDSVVLDA